MPQKWLGSVCTQLVLAELGIDGSIVLVGCDCVRWWAEIVYRRGWSCWRLQWECVKTSYYVLLPTCRTGTWRGGALSSKASLTTPGSQGLWSSENEVKHRLRGDLWDRREGFGREQSRYDIFYKQHFSPLFSDTCSKLFNSHPASWN